MANYTITDLIKDSIRILSGMKAVWPQFEGKEETINFDCATFNGCYASNNATLAYVFDCNLYVTPYTRRALTALKEARLKRNYFYVPFSNGDYPKDEEDRWAHLLDMKRRVEKEEFAEECMFYSDEHGIGELEEETLARCLEIPDSGIFVKHPNFETWVYPVFEGNSFDCCHGRELIGTFDTNNGRVVFVYRDGRTFVTRGYQILEELREAGYANKSLYVPLSNGEEIQEIGLKRRWEEILNSNAK